MAKEDHRKGKIDKALQGVDMRGIGDPGLPGSIVNTEVGTPEQVAVFDAYREIAKPYEDYFNGLAGEFLGHKTPQPGVTVPKYQSYWHPYFDFKVRDTLGTVRDAGITFNRHRTGKFPFWKHGFTCKEFGVGDNKHKRNKIEFSDDGKVKKISLQSIQLNAHAAGIFTGSINENMVAEDFSLSMEDPKRVVTSVVLIDEVNRTRERKAFILFEDGRFWGRGADGKPKEMDPEELAELVKFAFSRVQKLPPKEPPAENPQTPQE